MGANTLANRKKSYFPLQPLQQGCVHAGPCAAAPKPEAACHQGWWLDGPRWEGRP